MAAAPSADLGAMTMPCSWLSETGAGWRICIKVTPRARQSAIRGIGVGAGGAQHLKVQVTVAPERGKANEAVIKLLAKRLGIGTGRLSIVSGDTARCKTVAVEGKDQLTAQRLQALAIPD